MLRVLVTVIGCVLLASPVAAAPAARDVVGRMTVIPIGPGGSLAGAPVYQAGAVPEATFSIHLDSDLGLLDIEDYLQARSQLIGAHYSLWLYRFEAAGAAPVTNLPSPTLVIEPDAQARFPLGPNVIVAGQTYAWQIVAKITDTTGQAVQLWSSMLYFRTLPVETALPGLLGEPASALCRELINIAAGQQRSQVALATRLRGLQLYGNYPSASDKFFCTPLVGEETCPYLALDTGDELPIPLLLELGEIMAVVSAVKHSGVENVSAEELAGLGDWIYTLIGRWPELTVLPIGRRISTLAAVAERLNTAAGLDAAGTAALLNELLLAIDGVVAEGTAGAAPGYEQEFAAYAVQAGAWLSRLTALEPELTAVLGAEESNYWLEYFAEQQGQLEFLADEVGRGRLSKPLLSDQLRELRWSRIEADAEAFRYLTGTTCRVEPDRILRLTPADEPQLARLRAEVVRCHLLRLADYLWPEIH